MSVTTDVLEFILQVRGAAEARKLEEQLARNSLKMAIQKNDLKNLSDAYAKGVVPLSTYIAGSAKIEAALAREKAAHDRAIAAVQREATARQNAAARAAVAQQRAADTAIAALAKEIAADKKATALAVAESAKQAAAAQKTAAAQAKAKADQVAAWQRDNARLLAADQRLADKQAATAKAAAAALEKAADRAKAAADRKAVAVERAANREAAAAAKTASAAARRSGGASSGAGALGGMLGGIGGLNVPLPDIGGALSAVGGVVSNLVGKFALLTTGVAATGAALVALSVRDAIVAESQLSKLRKTSGLTGEALEGVRQQVAKLATTFGGMDFGEMIGVATMGARLGVAAKDIGNFTRDIGFMTIALDDIPAEEAATKIQRILNVFRIGTEHAIDFAASLNILDDTSTATGREILDVTQRLAGPAAALGLAPQKVMALAAAMKDAGIISEVAGTVMAQVLSKMASDPSKFAEVAGVSFRKFSSMLRADPLTALIAFEKGLKRLDGVSQLQVLESMGLKGARVKTSLLQLSNVLDKIPGYVKAGTDEWKSHDRLMREVNIASNTTEAQLKRMSQNWLQLSITVGNIALPVVRAMANALSLITNGLKNIVDANKDWAGGFLKPLEKAVEYSGLLVTHFKDFVMIGKEWSLEKWEQLKTILGRVGDQLGPNLKAAGTNAMVDFVQAVAKVSLLLEPTFIAVGEFFVDVWDKAGKQAVAKMVNPMKLAFMEIEEAWTLANTRGGEKAMEQVRFEFTKRRHELIKQMGGDNQGGFAGMVGPGMARFRGAQEGIRAQVEQGRVGFPGFPGLFAGLNQGALAVPGAGFVGPPAPGGQALGNLDRGAMQARDAAAAERRRLMDKPGTSFAGQSVKTIKDRQKDMADNLRENQRVHRQEIANMARAGADPDALNAMDAIHREQQARIVARQKEAAAALLETRAKNKEDVKAKRITLPNTALARPANRTMAHGLQQIEAGRAAVIGGALPGANGPGPAPPGPQAANQIGAAAAGVGAATVAALGAQRQINGQLVARLGRIEAALGKFAGMVAQNTQRVDPGLGSLLPRGGGV